MKHTFLKHKNCTDFNCPICEGGLSYCTTCKGAESGLTTDCCGYELTDQEQCAISCGDDYKDKKWHKVNIHA